MKNVKRLSVTVTYSVGLSDLQMPEKVLKELTEAANNGDTIEHGMLKYSEASEWINNNIKERDCFEHNTAIDEITE
ncbi:MAG: hypothetical protein V4538_01700 [Bacteroidota bacterium]